MDKTTDLCGSGPSNTVKAFRKFTDIMERVEQVRNHLRLSKVQFTRAIGMKPQTYNNFIGAQGSKPNVELIHGIVTKFRADPMWVLTGKGSMFLDAFNGAPEPAPMAPSGPPPDDTKRPEHPQRIEYIPGFGPAELVLNRIEAIFQQMDQQHAALLSRLAEVLKRYLRMDPAESADHLRDFLDYIERRMESN